MPVIKNNRENPPILNHIYYILAELHNQGQKIVLCKVSAHIRIKGNEETYKAAKQAIDMPGISITSYRPSSGLETLSGNENGKTVLVSYTTLNDTSNNGKFHTTAVGNIRSNEQNMYWTH